MKPRGFTLIELLVVVTIIGILMTVVITSLESARIKARDGKRLGDIADMKKALELYVTQNGSYPDPTVACGTSEAWSSWACWSTLLPSTYISSMPTDPQSVDLGSCGVTANCHIYHYCVYNNGQSYVLSVNLENPAPGGNTTNNGACPVGGPNYYWVGS